MPMTKSPSSYQHSGIFMPTAFVRRVTLESSGAGTQVTVQVVLKDIIKALSVMPDFLEHMKINIYQFLDPSAISRAIRGGRSSKGIYLLSNMKGVEKKVVSPLDYVRSDIALPERTFARSRDANGQSYDDYLYNVSFDIPTKDPNDLAYITQVEMDMEAIAKKENIKSIDTSGKSTRICGKVVTETIISGGKIKRDAFLFMVDDVPGLDKNKYQPGSIWAGAVHKHTQGGYMAGATHSSAPHPTLTKVPVVNPKIFDMRGNNSFENKPFLFESDQSSGVAVPTDLRADKKKHYKSKSYFSKPLMSRNEHGAATIMFSFDHAGYIKNETRFRDLLAKHNSFEEFFPITDVRLTRRRGTESPEGLRPTNDLGSPIDAPIALGKGGETVMDVPFPSDHTAGTTEYVWPPPAKEERSEIPSRMPRVSNTFEELASEPDVGTRTWVLVDNAVAELDEGIHQYEVTVTVEDRFIELIQRLSNTLGFSIDQMKKYFQSSVLCKHYDAVYDRFHPAFKASVQAHDWAGAINSFVKAQQTLYGAVDEEYVDNLMVVASPVTGNPAGITHVIDQMLSLDSKVKSVLGDQVRPPSARTKAVSVAGGSPKTISKVEITKTFDEIYDGRLAQNGISYLGEDLTRRGDVSRSKQITEVEYDNLVRSQAERFLVSQDLSSLAGVLKSLPKDKSVSKSAIARFASSLEQNRTLFFGPKSVKSGRDVISLDAEMGGAEDLDRYSRLTADMLAIGGSPYPLPASKNESETKLLTQSLNNVLKDVGLTIDFDLLDRNPQKDVVSETIGVSNEGDDRSFIDSSDMFANDNLSKKNIRNNKQNEYSIYDFDERDNLTAEVGKELLSFLATDASAQDKNDVKEFGFRTSMKKLDPLRNPDLLSRKNIKKLFSLPVQTLSLIFGRSPAVKKNWHDMNVDLLQDGSYTEFYRYNYDMIVKVKYLDGYSKTDGQTHLGDPIWKDLDNTSYRKIIARGRPTICKLEPHEDIDLGIGQTKSLNVPIYNEHFVFRPTDRSSYPRPTVTDVQDSFNKKVDRLMNNMSSDIVDYSNTVVINHSDMYRGR